MFGWGDGQMTKAFFCWLGHLKMSFYCPTSHRGQYTSCRYINLWSNFKPAIFKQKLSIIKLNFVCRFQGWRRFCLWHHCNRFWSNRWWSKIGEKICRKMCTCWIEKWTAEKGLKHFNGDENILTLCTIKGTLCNNSMFKCSWWPMEHSAIQWPTIPNSKFLV